jgi:hypothetical protein
LDENYLKTAIPAALNSMIPNLSVPKEIYFATEDTGKGIAVQTNLDFQALNSIYHRVVPARHSSLSPASILSELLEVECDLYFASTYLTEIASTELGSRLMADKITYLAHRRFVSRRNIEQFQQVVLGDARALREAINTGKVAISDALKIVRKPRKFKGWLAKQEVNADLIKDYYNELTKDSFIDRLPGKSLRWLIFAGLGLAADSVGSGGFGTLSGLAVSALDQFFIDKLIKGWKPTQFIEEDLKSWLKG